MSAWRRLLDFVALREDATSLALCRIAIGLTVFSHVLHFKLSGAASLALVHDTYGGIGKAHAWLGPVGGATPTNVALLTGVVVVAAACVTLGLFTRPALVVLWVSYRAMSLLNNDARGAYDAVVVNTLFILMLSGCGHALSLDARLWERAKEVARWPRMILVFHMGLLYSGSAITKASSGWVPGGDATALWYILHQPMWARGDFDGLPMWALPITQAATTAVWIWELLGLLFVAAVFLREREEPTTRLGRALKRILDRVRFRELYLLFGVGMHVGIEVTMEVGAFSFASLSLYFCALRPDDWRKIALKVRSSLQRRDSRSRADR